MNAKTRLQLLTTVLAASAMTLSVTAGQHFLGQVTGDSPTSGGSDTASSQAAGAGDVSTDSIIQAIKSNNGNSVCFEPGTVRWEGNPSKCAASGWRVYNPQDFGISPAPAAGTAPQGGDQFSPSSSSGPQGQWNYGPTNGTQGGQEWQRGPAQQQWMNGSMNGQQMPMQSGQNQQWGPQQQWVPPMNPQGQQWNSGPINGQQMPMQSGQNQQWGPQQGNPQMYAPPMNNPGNPKKQWEKEIKKMKTQISRMEKKIASLDKKIATQEAKLEKTTDEDKIEALQEKIDTYEEMKLDIQDGIDEMTMRLEEIQDELANLEDTATSSQK